MLQPVPPGVRLGAAGVQTADIGGDVAPAQRSHVPHGETRCAANLEHPRREVQQRRRLRSRIGPEGGQRRFGKRESRERALPAAGPGIVGALAGQVVPQFRGHQSPRHFDNPVRLLGVEAEAMRQGGAEPLQAAQIRETGGIDDHRREIRLAGQDAAPGQWLGGVERDVDAPRLQDANHRGDEGTVAARHHSDMRFRRETAPGEPMGDAIRPGIQLTVGGGTGLVDQCPDAGPPDGPLGEARNEGRSARPVRKRSLGRLGGPRLELGLEDKIGDSHETGSPCVGVTTIEANRSR